MTAKEWEDTAQFWENAAKRARERGQLAYAEYCDIKALACRENAASAVDETDGEQCQK